MASFTSADQTIGAGGTSATLAHGLGTAPKFVMMALVCQSADAGYVAGDVIQQFRGPGIAQGGCSVTIDATNVKVYWGSPSNSFGLNNKSTGTFQSVNSTNFKARFYAQEAT